MKNKFSEEFFRDKYIETVVIPNYNERFEVAGYAKEKEMINFDLVIDDYFLDLKDEEKKDLKIKLENLIIDGIFDFDGFLDICRKYNVIEGNKKELLSDVLGSDAKIEAGAEALDINKVVLSDGSTKINFSCKMTVDGVEVGATFNITKKAVLPLFGDDENIAKKIEKDVNGFFDILKLTTKNYLNKM